MVKINIICFLKHSFVVLLWSLDRAGTIIMVICVRSSHGVLDEETVSQHELSH